MNILLFITAELLYHKEEKQAPLISPILANIKFLLPVFISKPIFVF